MSDPLANHPKLGKVLDGLQRLYAVRDIHDFPSAIMAVAAEVVSCANVSFDTVDLATGRATDVFDRPIEISPDEFLKRWQVYCHQHPGIEFLEKGGKLSVFTLADFITQRELRKRALYHEIFKPCGGGYQIGVILPVPGYVVGMAINRDRRQFTTEECKLIELLHPHFVQAFQNAQLFTSLRGKPDIDFRVWRGKGLTRRECEVLQWIVEGKRNSEIAIILGGQTRTIDKHVENIFAKLGVETRAAAAAVARRWSEGSAVLPGSR